MSQYLKADTGATILIGPFVDKTNGVTPEVGLAAGDVDEIGVYKHDGTSLVDISGTTTFTHRAGGMYTLTLSTTDTNTEGRLTVYVRDDSVCLPVWKDFMVVNANVYDSLFAVAATDYLKVKDDEGNTLANEAKQDIIDTAADSIQVVTDKLGTAVEVDGAVYRFTTNALEQAPSGTANVHYPNE